MRNVDEMEFRLQELAAGMVLGDLSEAELLEAGSYDVSKFHTMVEQTEQAASRAWLSFEEFQPVEPMPKDVSDRIRATLKGFLSQEIEDPSERLSEPRLVHSQLQPTNGALGLRETFAWLCVAASIALTLCVVLPNQSQRTLTLQEQRSSLIASAGDLTRVAWTSTDASQANDKDLGEVVWSTKEQKGFMVFKNLPVNDSAKEQYQLWIIDPARDEKPIDGGVFDIVSKDEAIIPIHAKLKVIGPTVFAITVEKPGGVVVSDQKRLPLLAKVGL